VFGNGFCEKLFEENSKMKMRGNRNKYFAIKIDFYKVSPVTNPFLNGAGLLSC
jgi:hypothetical protein